MLWREIVFFCRVRRAHHGCLESWLMVFSTISEGIDSAFALVKD